MEKKVFQTRRIEDLYPNARKEVVQKILEDPLQTARMRLGEYSDIVSLTLEEKQAILEVLYEALKAKDYSEDEIAAAGQVVFGVISIDSDPS